MIDDMTPEQLERMGRYLCWLYQENPDHDWRLVGNVMLQVHTERPNNWQHRIDQVRQAAKFARSVWDGVAVPSPSQADRIEALLTRLAEALEKMVGAPVNAYGETFVDAIQNAHERGLRGINTNDR